AGGRAPRPRIVSSHKQSAVIEKAELLRLGLYPVVASDRPPKVALHRLRSAVAPTHAERKAVGGVTDEFRMQQRRQCRTDTGGERSVKLLSGRHLGVEGVISRHRELRSPSRALSSTRFLP